MTEKETEEELGRELKENNEKIVHCLLELKTQRADLIFLIQKQKEERRKLEMEMERLTYKLCLINKSMAQRMKAKNNYDATIEEIEEKYKKLKENSGDLMHSVTKDCNQLDSLINKKTSTEDTQMTKDAGTEDSSTELSTKSTKSSEECICPATKDGKCAKVSKMIQAAPPEVEVPTKLEKESSSESKSKSSNTSSGSSKHSAEKGAQTVTAGEPKDSEEDVALKDQKTKLNRAASQYRETSLRRSQ